MYVVIQCITIVILLCFTVTSSCSTAICTTIVCHCQTCPPHCSSPLLSLSLRHVVVQTPWYSAALSLFQSLFASSLQPSSCRVPLRLPFRCPTQYDHSHHSKLHCVLLLTAIVIMLYSLVDLHWSKLSISTVFTVVLDAHVFSLLSFVVASGLSQHHLHQF